MTYEQFDVVVVPFPFTEAFTNKKRPALVLSDEQNFNGLLKKSIMAMITTATHTPWALDVAITDLKGAGLKAASVVRMKLFTLDDVLVSKRIGTLSQLDIVAVNQALQKLFDF